jgi:hypothetical protein
LEKVASAGVEVRPQRRVQRVKHDLIARTLDEERPDRKEGLTIARAKAPHERAQLLVLEFAGRRVHLDR